MSDCFMCYRNLQEKGNKVFCDYDQEYTEPMSRCAAQLKIGHSEGFVHGQEIEELKTKKEEFALKQKNQ